MTKKILLVSTGGPPYDPGALDIGEDVELGYDFRRQGELRKKALEFFNLPGIFRHERIESEMRIFEVPI